MTVRLDLELGGPLTVTVEAPNSAKVADLMERIIPAAARAYPLAALGLARDLRGLAEAIRSQPSGERKVGPLGAAIVRWHPGAPGHVRATA